MTISLPCNNSPKRRSQLRLHAVFARKLQRIWAMQWLDVSILELLAKYFPWTENPGAPNLLPINGTRSQCTTRYQCLNKFLAIAWSQWNRRNKWLYDNNESHPSLAFEFALAMQQSFSTLWCQPSSTNRSLGKWSKPLANFLKLNVDGVLFFDQKRAGLCHAVCDLDATLCFAASIGIPCIQDLEIVDLLALLRGLQLCLAWGISHLLVESNCQLMVNACNSSTFQDSQLGNIIDEIRWINRCF